MNKSKRKPYKERKTSPNSEIGKLILGLEINKQMVRELNDSYKATEGTIRAHMTSNKVKRYILSDKQEKRLSASIYERKTTTMNHELLKETLTKKQLKQISDEFMIAEQEGLRQFIKRHPELREELKEFITRSVTINEHKLDVAIEKGIITKEDLEGCYEESITEVFKLQRVNPQEEQE